MAAQFPQNLPRFELDLTGSILFLLVAAIAAVAFSAYVYRQTVPEVPTAVRRLLLALRALALLLIILLLSQPIVRLTFTRLQRPTVAILVDDSASMALTDGRGSRSQQVRQALTNPAFELLRKEYDLRYFRFSDHLTPWDPGQDSLRFDGDGTDLQKALAQARETLHDSSFAAAVLLTDGADNLGQNPARYVATYGVPVYVVGIGDPSEAKDVLISSYSTNDIVYAGNRVPVDVTVKSYGYDGRRVTVVLKQAGRTLDQTNLTLAGGMLEQVVRLYFTPKKEGFQKFELSLPALEGELTSRNNRMAFYVKVLKGKMKVLLVAGGPSPDFAFLRRALESDANIELRTFVERQRGAFYEGSFPRRVADLKAFDLVAFLDYPRPTSNPAVVKAVADLVVAESKPLLLLFGPATSLARLAPLKNALPIVGAPTPIPEQQVFAQLTPEGFHHPLMRIAEEQTENTARWEALPPVFSIWANIRTAPGSQVLATAVRQKGSRSRSARPQPMIVARRAAGTKSVVVMAYGLWRWKFLMVGAGKPADLYQKFFSNAVRWLSTREDTKLVRVRPNKEIYHSGEQVRFSAQVYYEDYVPVDGAELKITVRADTTVEEFTLLGMGEGRYEGKIQVLSGGDYRYEAVATKDGRVLGRDQGQFSVEPFTLEFQSTRMNEPLLREIASRSGGKFYDPTDLEKLATDLKLRPRQITEARELPLWNSVPLLAFVLLLLSTEWFLRKRKGMV
jgi:hypothetical protein